MTVSPIIPSGMNPVRDEPTDPVFELDAVGFAYEREPVLMDVSFVIPRGSFFGIIGPNGSGKTTVLKLLNGTLTPGTGAVRFEGKSVDAMSRMQTARRIAHVPQQEGAVFPFSVKASVMLGRYPYRSGPGFETVEDWRLVDEALHVLELDHLRDRSVTTLSGGERHRVMIARALAQATPVILLDEPTAHLDIYHQHAVFALLHTLCRKRGLTIVCVTHELMLSSSYCDHLVLLGAGRVHAHGAASAVLTAENLSACFHVLADVRQTDQGILVHIPPFHHVNMHDGPPHHV